MIYICENELVVDAAAATGASRGAPVVLDGVALDHYGVLEYLARIVDDELVVLVAAGVMQVLAVVLGAHVGAVVVLVVYLADAAHVDARAKDGAALGRLVALVLGDVVVVGEVDAGADHASRTGSKARGQDTLGRLDGGLMEADLDVEAAHAATHLGERSLEDLLGMSEGAMLRVRAGAVVLAAGADERAELVLGDHHDRATIELDVRREDVAYDALHTLRLHHAIDLDADVRREQQRVEHEHVDGRGVRTHGVRLVELHEADDESAHQVGQVVDDVEYVQVVLEPEKARPVERRPVERAQQLAQCAHHARVGVHAAAAEEPAAAHAQAVDGQSGQYDERDEEAPVVDERHVQANQGHERGRRVGGRRRLVFLVIGDLGRQLLHKYDHAEGNEEHGAHHAQAELGQLEPLLVRLMPPVFQTRPVLH